MEPVPSNRPSYRRALENTGDDAATVARYCMYYNFVRVHQTLRVPAMEAAIADHVWSIEEIVSLLLQ
jgi:hypothetical protein